ncbi:MAG: four helix bundle protein [Verrucomicrobiota bacterium]
MPACPNGWPNASRSEGRSLNAECRNRFGRTHKNFARRIIRLYSALPKETIAQVLGKQLLRAGTSIGANYREARRGRSKASSFPKSATA